MQHVIGEAGQALQAGAIVEVGQHRLRAGSAPDWRPGGIAQHGENAIMAGKADKNTAGHVPAANNQDFLHAGIVADVNGNR